MQGDSGVSCHEDEEAELGHNMVSGDRLEPHPIDGKQAVVELATQAAHDSENLYFRFQWKTRNSFAGAAHPNWIIPNAPEPLSGQQRCMDTVVSVRKASLHELLALLLRCRPGHDLNLEHP